MKLRDMTIEQLADITVRPSSFEKFADDTRTRVLGALIGALVGGADALRADKRARGLSDLEFELKKHQARGSDSGIEDLKEGLLRQKIWLTKFEQRNPATAAVTGILGGAGLGAIAAPAIKSYGGGLYRALKGR